MKKYKVTIVGAGNVGATAAQILVQKNICDIVLIDINEGVAKGKCMDIAQYGALNTFDYSILGGSDYNLTKDSDIVVITAGLARKPGMSRDDLLLKNTEIVSSVAKNIKEFSPNAIVINVTNPMDIMTYVVKEVTGFDEDKIIGMGGILDTARYKYFISNRCNVAGYEIDALVVGAHGDSMVPVTSLTKVKDVVLAEMLSDTEIQELVQNTKTGGAQIVAHLGTGSAFVAPAASVATIVSAILKDEKSVHPCCTFRAKKYTEEAICCGINVVIGKNGIEDDVKIDFTDAEREAFITSCVKVKEQIEKVKQLSIF